MVEPLLLLAGGFFAGTLGGLLGIGGGIAVMPLLRFVLRLSPAHAAGTCILAVFFTTLGGSYRHYRLGRVHLRSLGIIVISGAVATFAGSFVFRYLATRERWLDLGLGLVFLLVSARMLTEGISRSDKTKDTGMGGNEVKGTPLQKMTIGSVAGILPGTLGIGTGSILVPAFTFLLGSSIKTAMASSLTCFCFNALISSAFKIVQGFVALDVVIPLCIGTFLGANLGAVLNKRFSSAAVRLIFGSVFLYVSLKFLLLFFGVRI